jgi:hypothetical protein
MENSLCVFIQGCGLVPVNYAPYEFLTSPPIKIGDDTLIVSNGKRHKVRLLSSVDMVKNALYLVDMRHGN